MRSVSFQENEQGADDPKASVPHFLVSDTSSYRFCVDLHVHTRRFSDCAESLDPVQIPLKMKECGIAGLVLAEHDSFWTRQEVGEIIRPGREQKIYRGIECSARGCHILIIGISEMGPLRRGITAEKAVACAKEQGGVAILAHPYRDSRPEMLPVHLFDGVEVGSTSFSREESGRAMSLARRHNACMVAGSDAHSISRIGSAVTCFDRLPADESELAALIRKHDVLPRFNRRFPSW